MRQCRLLLVLMAVLALAGCARSTAVSTKGISNVWSSAQLNTKREYQSSTATRYSQPAGKRTYVLSIPQT